MALSSYGLTQDWVMEGTLRELLLRPMNSLPGWETQYLS